MSLYCVYLNLFVCLLTFIYIDESDASIREV